MSEHLPMEETDTCKAFVAVADQIWDLVVGWPELGRRTVGEQVIRACDSVGANLIEGDGRYSDADALHFFVMARGSARETRYWIARAVKRRLIETGIAAELNDAVARATKGLNALINYRRKTKNQNLVKEERAAYADGIEFPNAQRPTPNA